MTITSYPFADQSTSEAQFRKLFREIQGVPATVLGGSGSGQLAVSANGANMNLSVALGGAIVQSFYFDSDSAATVAIAAASSVARTDIVALRLTPSVAGTPGSIALVAIRGNTSTGAAPTLVQTDTGIYEFPLASVLVAANATSIPAANVTDLRSFLSNVNSDSGWQNIGLASGTLVNNATPQVRVYRGVVYFRGDVKGSSTWAANGTYNLAPAGGLPVGARPAAGMNMPVISTGGAAARVLIGIDGSIVLANGPTAVANICFGGGMIYPVG